MHYIPRRNGKGERKKRRRRERRKEREREKEEDGTRKSGEKKGEGEKGKAGKDLPLKPRRTEFKSSLNPAGRERVSLKP